MIGVNNSVTIIYQTANGKNKEVVVPERVQIVAQALGIMGASETDVYIYKNFNYVKKLNRIDEVKNGDIIELVERSIVEQREDKNLDLLRREIIDIRGLINDLRANSGDEEDITYLELLLAIKESELEEFEIEIGAASGLPVPERILNIDHTPEPESEGTEPIGTEPVELQTIFVSWDNTDRFVDYGPIMGTCPGDIETFDITVETEDGQPTDREFTVTVEVDTTMIEGENYTTFDFVTVIPEGTVDGHIYTATWEACDEGTPGPDDADLTLTANNGVIPVGSTTNPLTVTWSALA